MYNQNQLHQPPVHRAHRFGRRWQRTLAAVLSLLTVLALNRAPVAYAYPPLPSEARINGTDCFLVDAITAANSDTATNDCAAGTPGADTIELLDNVTLFAGGLPEVTSEITIEGAGLTIARDPGAPSFSIVRVANSGKLTLNSTTISGGNVSGGGFFNRGTLTLNNSTVSGNTATTQGTSLGGGIANLGTVTLNNSTVSGNSATGGGGIYNNGTLLLNNSTVSDNTGFSDTGGPSSGGIAGSGSTTLSNSIVANQAVGTDCSTGITSAGYSLDSDGTCNLTATGDISNGMANLGPLQVNAPGNTATHALLAGSDAIDAAPSGLATDQRGVSRPQGCAFDIGAFELEQAGCSPNNPPTANAGSDQTVFRNESVTVSGTWTDPEGAADNPYSWSWDLDGDAIADDSGSANYGDTIARTTDFGVDGIATLTFSVTDKNGATSSDTVDITVVNRAPIANDQSVSTDEDTDLPITLTASDEDGDPLTYSVLTLPTNGTLSGIAPNLTYTPNPDFFGPDSFTFQVNDGLANSNTATVSITVNPVNDPPIAVDDIYTTDEDTPVDLFVLDNDSAGPANENQQLNLHAISFPEYGILVSYPGGMQYLPNTDFNGTDSFTYQICDSDGACDTATVTLLVETVNDPPTAGDDSVTTDEDTPVTFDVLANDNDVDGDLDPASVSVVSGSSNGTLTHNGNGSFTYAPDANFNGTDSFTYQVCDSNGICDSATVTLSINPVNDAPTCTDVTPDVTTLWPPNHQFVPITVSGATDIEGDTITVSVTSIFQDEPTNGTGDGDTSPDGQGIGSSTAEVRSERQGNSNGRYYHITVSASDGNGGTCSATVQVSVPKNQGKKGAAVDDGPLYDSTQP